MACVNYDFDHCFTTSILAGIIKDPATVNLSTDEEIRRYGQMADCITFRSRESMEQNHGRAMKNAPNATRILVFEETGIRELPIAGRIHHTTAVC